MSLSIGIVGLPNVGKSTLFNALTKKSVSTENYPFCTIDPSVGVVPVPDERLQRLSAFSNSEKSLPPIVEFIDIAGLVKGASEGEGLGNQFLSNIREVDVIAHIVRFFDDNDIAHVHGEVCPLDDIQVINIELIMADMQTIEKRLASVGKEMKKGDKDARTENELLQILRQHLERGKLVSTLKLSEKDTNILKGLHLLTAKPMLYVLNKKSGGHNIDEINDERFESCMEYFKKENMPSVMIDARTEGELNDVAFDDKEKLRRELGALDDSIDTLIKKGYEMLDLITFFTIGENETRGWTIKKGSTAPVAGAAIHTDFRDKFIRADVINWESLLQAGSYAAAREKGLIKTVGKDYVVEDGDVVEFKI